MKKEEVKEYEFVYMADRNFLMPIVVSLGSLIASKSEGCKYRIHVILDNVPSQELYALEVMRQADVDIVFHNMNSAFCEEISKRISNPNIKISRTDMLKFELPKYLDDVDKILYLDGDLLINKNIEELFQIDLDGMYLAAVNDMGDRYDEEGRSLYASRIGWQRDDYFNAGMMLLNLKQMRIDKISEKLWDYRKNGINYCMSQDALNVVTGGKRVQLDYCYNFIVVLFHMYPADEVYKRFCSKDYIDVDACLDDQSILHMAGDWKPWIYNVPWMTERFLVQYRNTYYAKRPLSLKSPIYEIQNNSSRDFYDVLWHCFKWNIPEGSEIILFGAGNRGRFFYQKNLWEKYCIIRRWVDSNADKIYMENTRIDHPEVIRDEKFDRVVIANADENAINEICEYLRTMGIPTDWILSIG